MIQVGAGVVDYDYRGEVGVVLFNHGSEDFEIQVGDRVSQLILEEVAMCPAVEVEALDGTERGAGGFGSTGVADQVQATPQKRAKTEEITPVKGGGELAAKRVKTEEIKPVKAIPVGSGFAVLQGESPLRAEAW